MEITKEQFEVFEEIRMSGLTNMFNVSKVIEIAERVGVELDKQIVTQIMKEYNKLQEKYGEKQTS